MKNSQKIRVAVIYGGRSGEHEVSLMSGASIVKSLDKNKYEVIPIGIDKAGQWYLNKPHHCLDHSEQSLVVSNATSEMISIPETQNGNLQIDVVFPAMHGPLYEDGSIQGLLEVANIPYVGPGVLSSALCMDKAVCKALLKSANIPIIPYSILHRYEWQADSTALLNQLVQQHPFPLFVKPSNMGSSVGIHKVANRDELQNAINDAFQYDVKILIEEDAKARDVEFAVLENLEYGAAPLVSVSGEIKISERYPFYNYEAKYLDPDSLELQIPADITPEQTALMQSLSIKIFQTLQCEGMARMDFFIRKDTGAVLFNEANSIPGFTNMSMFPLLWKASGKSYSELLTHLIDLALARAKRQRSIKRDWQ